MANTDFSIESLIAESTGLTERKPIQQTTILSEEAYDGDEDSLTKEFYKSVEDFDSYCTLERLNHMHNDEKIRMLNNLRRVYGDSIQHYGAKLSIESYIDREIYSIEDNNNKNTNEQNTDGKKENPIIRFFKFVGRLIAKAAKIIRDKLKEFWGWLTKKIQSLRERKGDNVVADVANIEKAMDSVISEIENADNSTDETDSDTNSNDTDSNTSSKTSKSTKKSPEFFQKKFETIKGMIDKSLAKIKKAKESNEENAKSNDVNEAEKKLEASKKEVESIIGGMAAFLKKPNGLGSKLKGIKQRLAEAKEKSKAIKSAKTDMQKILKELGTNKIVDIRSAQGGQNSKLVKYLTNAENFAKGMKGKIGTFFREGQTPQIDLQKPENDKSDFDDFDKFVVNVMGWKFITISDVKKGEVVIKEVYTTQTISALTKFFDELSNKLGETASSLESLVSTVVSLAEQQQNNGSSKTINQDGLNKLKEAVQIHTTVFSKSQINISKINIQCQKIMRALYEIGTPGGENPDNMIQGNNLPAQRNAA